MIEIKCPNTVYERLIEMASTYYDSSANCCFLGRRFYSCPAERNKELTCNECLRKHIQRV